MLQLTRELVPRTVLVAVAAVVSLVVLAAAPAAAAPSEQDTTWMAAAHQSNLAEIAAGTAAQQQATSQDVKALGQMFVQMHTDLDAALTAAASQLGVALPAAPSPQQQAQLDAVKANSGDAFDTAWISQQIGSHATSLDGTQKELQLGSDPAVLALAQTAKPVIEAHLADVQALADARGIPNSVPGGTGGQAAESSGSPVVLGLMALGAALVATGLLLLLRRRRAPALT